MTRITFCMTLIRACIGLSLAVLAFPVSLVAQPAASQLQFGPEHAVSDAASLVASHNSADMPVVATNGDQFLVVWSDRRSGRLSVYAARVDLTGRILDPAGIRISSPSLRPQPSDLAIGMSAVWNGSSYLIAYTTWDGDGGYSILLARVAPDGGVLSRDVFFRRGTTPRFAATDSTALLLYRPWPDVSQFALAAAILDEQGGVHRDTPISSSTDAFPGSVAWNGEKFFAVWRELDEIFGTPLDAEGRPPGLVNQSVSRHSPTGFDVAVATDGSGFLAVWHEFYGSNSRVRGRFIRQDGVVAGEPFFITSEFHNNYEPDVIWDGSRYIVSYLSPSSSAHSPYATYLQTIEVSPSGEVGSSSRTITTGMGVRSYSTIAAGNKVLMAWSDNRLARSLYVWEPAVFIRVVEGSDSGHDVLLSRSHSPQNDADAVWTGDSYLAAWTEIVNPDQLQAVVAGRLTRDGRSMDGPGVRLQFSSREQSWPSVSFNGSSTLVVWTERQPDAFDRGSIYG